MWGGRLPNVQSLKFTFFYKKQQQQMLKVSNHFVAIIFNDFLVSRFDEFLLNSSPYAEVVWLSHCRYKRTFFFGCWERFECFSLPPPPPHLFLSKKKIPKKEGKPKREEGEKQHMGILLLLLFNYGSHFFPLYVQGFPPHSPQGFPFQRQNVQIFLVRIKNTNYCAGEIIGSLLPPPSFCTTVR